MLLCTHSTYTFMPTVLHPQRCSQHVAPVFCTRCPAPLVKPVFFRMCLMSSIPKSCMYLPAQAHP